MSRRGEGRGGRGREEVESNGIFLLVFFGWEEEAGKEEKARQRMRTKLRTSA